MEYSEEKFREHLHKIVSTNEGDSNRALSREELKELALSMGLSESEWAALMVKAEEQLRLALNHMKVQNYAEAIVCAEEATAIDPYIKDGNAVLAQSYYKLGIQNSDEKLLIKAEQCARMELKNDPMDATATNVLGAIESHNSENKFSFTLTKKVALACALLAVIFIILYMCSNRAQHNDMKDLVEQQNELRSNSINMGSVESAKQAYINAVKRRNNNLLTIAPVLPELQEEIESAIDNYDFEASEKSERKILKLIGSLKSEGNLSIEQEATLDGDANRISTEKGRWTKAIAAYNQNVDDSGDGEKLEYPQ